MLPTRGRLPERLASAHPGLRSVLQFAMSLYMGPTVERWTPASWGDVESAAAAGLLDETHWVELKKAVPADSKAANRELAKDLASLACDGGLLVIGIEDDSGKAGAVVGTSLAGLQDRIDQVAGAGIDPPLVVRSIPLPHPSMDGHGCLLIVLDASADGPHMVEGSYWGRGDTGKRPLIDLEVRRRLAENEQRRNAFEDRFAAARHQAPLGGPGVLHVLFRPRAGRRGALAAEVDSPRNLFHDLTVELPLDPDGWTIGELDQVRRVLHGAELSNFEVPRDRAANLKDAASQIEAHLRSARIEDDGTLFYSCSRLTYGAGQGGATPQPLMSTRGVLALTEWLTIMAGRLGDRAGYAGSWDIGLALAGLEGHSAAPANSGRLTGLYRATYPEDEYLGLTTTTATELNSNPQRVVDRLLRPAFRILGVEQQIDDMASRSS
ncbi:hypothetical protein FHU33_0173 [Blastococcus colisei]|uniref:Schlafen AlbA-2 domain-containing protein n=2 Tax=Blastococcus colisei TaxID=1564162 RepID=A0A543P9Q7_9ACTN|nr:hypothetical protein FHU33_0173 [Blastococcus colisei]